MFKKFSQEDISSNNQLKNSAQRAISQSIVQTYPNLEHCIDTILPKKGITVGKAPDNIQLLYVGDEVLFFCQKGGAWFPTLKLLHKYPTMMKSLVVDKGATKFLLSGANLMAPGIVKAGRAIRQKEIKEGDPVAIYATDKKHCMAMGVATMSSEDIESIGKGVAVEINHFLLDGLYTNSNL